MLNNHEQSDEKRLSKEFSKKDSEKLEGTQDSTDSHISIVPKLKHRRSLIAIFGKKGQFKDQNSDNNHTGIRNVLAENNGKVEEQQYEELLEELSVEMEASIDLEWSHEIHKLRKSEEFLQSKLNSSGTPAHNSPLSGQWPSQDTRTSGLRRCSKSFHKEINEVASLHRTFRKTLEKKNHNHQRRSSWNVKDVAACKDISRRRSLQLQIKNQKPNASLHSSADLAAKLRHNSRFQANLHDEVTLAFGQ